MIFVTTHKHQVDTKQQKQNAALAYERCVSVKLTAVKNFPLLLVIAQSAVLSIKNLRLACNSVAK